MYPSFSLAHKVTRFTGKNIKCNFVVSMHSIRLENREDMAFGTSLIFRYSIIFQTVQPHS